ncbi:hypothetical protein HNY73_018013 [Argiope bruennichi]|uniref:Uncharacterized protein n=1 Tax=Argiope bruennichi TaxID=94029 RepID=A0A8T0EBJ6_ARGBR|nr:hypothetical protein HNY73_018013 [Argiope bruennichi]
MYSWRAQDSRERVTDPFGEKKKRAREKQRGNMSSPGPKSSKARLTLCDNVRMSTSDGFINGRTLRQASMYNWSFLAGALRNQCSTSDSGESGKKKGREVKPESIINLDFPVHGTLPQQELATMASLCSCAVTNLPCNGCGWMMKRFRGTLTREKKSHFVAFHCIFILGSGFCPLTRLKNPSFRVHRRGQRVGLLVVGRFLNSGTGIVQTSNPS